MVPVPMFRNFECNDNLPNGGIRYTQEDLAWPISRALRQQNVQGDNP